MKTEYEPEDIKSFLRATVYANPDSIKQLSEGHISQALTFENFDGNKQVLRISTKDEDFRADDYAYRIFGSVVPVPEILEIGSFGDKDFYCISKFIEGTTTNKLNNKDMQDSISEQNDIFGRIFNFDISATSGYGSVDINTGNAPRNDWKSFLTSDVESMGGVDELRKNAINIGLEPSLIDKFIKQFVVNVPYASEVRRLLHGDLGFDNMIVSDGKVTAVIDWAHVSYGDWMRDYAKFDFWWPDRYTQPRIFAKSYSLEAEHMHERTALYWAHTALGTISFADRFKNGDITKWLHEHIEEKLI